MDRLPDTLFACTCYAVGPNVQMRHRISWCWQGGCGQQHPRTAAHLVHPMMGFQHVTGSLTPSHALGIVGLTVQLQFVLLFMNSVLTLLGMLCTVWLYKPSPLSLLIDTVRQLHRLCCATDACLPALLLGSADHIGEVHLGGAARPSHCRHSERVWGGDGD